MNTKAVGVCTVGLILWHLVSPTTALQQDAKHTDDVREVSPRVATARATEDPPGPVTQPVNEKPVEIWTTTQPIAGRDPVYINRAIEHLRSLGASKTGIAYLVGNFLQEKGSAFSDGEPCGGMYGDGGLAHGFAQWHPGRRHDMPCGFEEQLTWAVTVEMPRDASAGHYTCLCDAIRTDDVGLITQAIKQWERYGHEGLRFAFGADLLLAMGR